MRILRTVAPALAAGFLAVASPALSQPVDAATPTYADLADLADSARIVLIVQPRKVVRVENARAPGLKPGEGRFYVEARTQALVFGQGGIGETLSYLVDLPLDARGRPPRLKRQDVILFARPVPGRPREVQLVSPGAQLARTAPTEATLRAILLELASPDSPARVTGVREIIHVPGTLAGEGETQIFLATDDGSAASLTVRRDAQGGTSWGASFSELVADAGNPPRPETLEWYRLACFLPNRLPMGTNLSLDPASRRQAEADYRLVLGGLGPCPRTLRQN